MNIKEFLRDIFAPRICIHNTSDNITPETIKIKKAEEAFRKMDEAFKKMDEAFAEIFK